MATATICTAFTHPDVGAAREQCRHVADSLHKCFQNVATVMDQAEDDALAFMDCPKALRSKLHSTNPLERLDKEVKRRTNVVGIYPNEAAIVRLVSAILLEQNHEWAVSRRYMSLETIAELCEPDNSDPLAIAVE